MFYTKLWVQYVLVLFSSILSVEYQIVEDTEEIVFFLDN